MSQQMPDISRIMKSKKLSGAFLPEEWIQLLSQLEAADQAGEKKTLTGIFAIVGSAVLFMIAIFLGLFVSGLFFFLIAAAVIGIAVGVFMLIRASSQDLDNGFRVYLLPLLKSLAEEMKPDKALSLEIEMIPITNKKYLRSQSNKYSKGAYHKCYDFHYEREFVDLKAPLYDGNRLSLNVYESLDQAKMTKKNPRGKIKTKLKNKKQRIGYLIRLRVDPERYDISGLETVKADPAIKKLDIKQSEKGPVVSLVHTVKLKKDCQYPDAELSLKLIGKLYAGLTPAKQPLAG